MPRTKPERPKLVYRVITTEFWRNSYTVEAENHGAALVMFECLKQVRALPKPERMLLGVIDPPEQVLDADGQSVYTNYPPSDDAEKMLFIEMWVRMLEAKTAEGYLTAGYLVKLSILFICRMKRWDPQPMLAEVRVRTEA